MSSLHQHIRILPSLLKKTDFLRHSGLLIRCMSTYRPTFKYDDLEITNIKPEESKPLPDPETLVFGQEFSDHMFTADWNNETGWDNPRIAPVQNFSIHPAAKVFHYAVECFEGMKAYRCVDGKVRLFRPDQNVDRMLTSSARSVMPTFDKEEMLKCLKKLVSIDKKWVPDHPTSSLYVRPTMIGTEPSLGVSTSKNAKLYILTGPVGPYYPTGFKPVSLLADPQFVRASKGGVGGYKMGSNYAPTIYIQNEAVQKHNCQQVLWLYGEDHQVTEVGTMNFFIYWINEQGEKELLTPTLDSGLILPGVTRKSLIELASTWGEFKVTQRDFFMSELTKGLKENRVLEIFGSGTACVVCPVEKIIYEGQTLEIPTMDNGAPIINRLAKELNDIQYGKVQSEWAVEVD